MCFERKLVIRFIEWSALFSTYADTDPYANTDNNTNLDANTNTNNDSDSDSIGL